MSFSYSPSTGGFYNSGIHAESAIPADAIAITDAQYATLLAGVNSGQIIAIVDGAAVLQAPPAVPPAPPTVPASIAIWRAKAVLEGTPFIPSSAQASVQAIVAGCTNLETAAQALITAQNSGALSSFWASGGDILRSSPALANLATMLNLTSAQIDTLFLDAQNIPPL